MPKFVPDESEAVAVLRVEKQLTHTARQIFSDAAQFLLNEFRDKPEVDAAYSLELLYLISEMRGRANVEALERIALDEKSMAQLAHEVRWALLNVLVDGVPPRRPEFWFHVLEADPLRYGSIAISGLVSLNPRYAIAALSKLPDSHEVGRAVAMKIDLAWDALDPTDRMSFAYDVGKSLIYCQAGIRAPLEEWVNSKNPYVRERRSELLEKALESFLPPGELAPRARTPKLCEHATM